MIPPGAVIGMLGGGQLGRMTALSARAMGYRFHVLDPDPTCAAAPVSDRCVAARFDDVDAAGELARHCDVVTLEIEQIATTAIDAAAAHAPTRPGSTLIGIVQDRGRQKQWLKANGFPLAAFRSVDSAADIVAALDTFGDTFVKARRGGYDGRSQLRLGRGADARDAWEALGERPAVAERAVDLAGELSVMVARRPTGDTAVFPVALNHHERQILSWSVIPAPLSGRILEQARDIGIALAEKSELEGVLAVEFFLTADGDVLVNELAPRPHNSFHATERACVTSQFEQLTRAVCDLPLGDVGVVRPAAIVNLFGDLWSQSVPDFSIALTESSVRLHLYGKTGARSGRKMGHLSAVGGSSMDALTTVRLAAERIGVCTEEFPSALQAFRA